MYHGRAEVTAYPSTLAVAATWDADLGFTWGEAILVMLCHVVSFSFFHVHLSKMLSFEVCETLVTSQPARLWAKNSSPRAATCF